MEKPPEKTNWRRIGLTATVLFVPGGFVIGALLAARRRRERLAEEAAHSADAAKAPSGHED